MLAMLVGLLIAATVWILTNLFSYSIIELLHKVFFTYHYTEATGGFYLANWAAIRYIGGILFAVLLCGYFVSIVLTASIASNRTRRKTVSKAASLTKYYYSHDVEAFDVFPADFIELSVINSDQKAVMLHHEQSLKDEAARKNDLVAYLAHDLKTPLTSIIGYLSFLNEVPEMPTEQRARYVGITLEKAYRLEQLIGEFFEITHYNLTEIPLQPETFDFNLLFAQLIDEFEPILKSKGNTVRLAVPQTLSYYGDPDKLGRVMSNLLKNAAAYSYPHSVITISAENTPDGLKLSFVNHGKTIPEHRLEMIFEKFYRLDDARSTNSGGAGLGLAIAREIVRQHGGSICAQSKDEITSFTVLLPYRK